VVAGMVRGVVEGRKRIWFGRGASGAGAEIEEGAGVGGGGAAGSALPALNPD
jgi:hypothetical protein